MKNFLREYFTFSRRERNGILVLLIILIASLFAPFLLPYFIKSEKTDFSAFQQEIAGLKKIQAPSDSSREKEQIDLPQKTKISTIELFPFDPNTATIEEWKKLGIREKTAANIKKYRLKGGKFFNKDDLKKIYGFSEEDYDRLASYIIIDKEKIAGKYDKQKDSTQRKTTANVFTIEINTADSAEWTKLKGIGEKFAAKIVKYRNALGGFIDVKQVSEVWGIDSVLFPQIRPQLVLEDSSLRKININSADLEQLKKHPYLSIPVAKLIVNYRQQHGNYSSVDDLKKLVLMNEELFKKLSPYLTIH